MNSVRDYSGFCSRNFILEIIEVLKANLLICVQKFTLLLSKLLNGADAVGIKLVCSYRPDSPYLAQLF